MRRRSAIASVSAVSPVSAPALALVLALVLVAAALAVPGSARAGGGDVPVLSARTVDVITVDAVISPIVVEQVRQGIARAERDERLALVIELDTPGGLETSMRSIVKDILASRVPVITYVTPGGARAASAGLFLVTASHVAAMAPNTNLGAASPVAFGGAMDSTMKHKAENDAAAFIRTLAAGRGRNADWNERAVREAVACSEKEAVELRVVDLVATDVVDLLRQASGRVVKLPQGEDTLSLAGATVHRIAPTFRQRALSTLADPTVAYILFNLGTLGLVFELSNPGAILPGVIGAIALVLALIAFQTLPVNAGGLLLLLLAVAFFVIELKVQSHGILAVGGVLAFLAGSLLLFEPGLGSAFRISLGVILGTTAGVAAFFLFAVGAGLRAQRLKPATGSEGLVGERGVALSACGPAHAGQVQVHGEIWRALPAPGSPGVAPGDGIVVVRVQGLTAYVQATPEG